MKALGKVWWHEKGEDTRRKGKDNFFMICKLW